jgi:uroporphyrinogen-III synthase
MRAPVTIVIGDVAGLNLASIEDHPLHGWQVVVTRAADQAGDLLSMLALHGAQPISLPTIAIDDPIDGGVALRDALCRLDTFDWLVFSSVNVVERVFSALRDARDLGRASIAAIGSETTRALLARGIVADLVPERYVADALVEVFPSPGDALQRGRGRVLIPRAHIAPNTLPEGLTYLGWEVEVVEAYRTVHPPIAKEALEDLRDADMVIFTSSSAVTGFMELAGAHRVPVVIASIGPVTSKTLREAGLQATIEATEHTISGLMREILTFAKAHPRPA